MIFFSNKPLFRITAFCKDSMSDSEKLKPETLPTEPAEAEDESIIDLVEEIEELSPSQPSSPLDQPLPAIDEAFNDVATSAAGLADLGKIGFDEEEDQPEGDDPSLIPATRQSDAPVLEENMDWLLDPEAEASAIEGGPQPDSSTGAHLEYLEFKESAPDAEAMLDAVIPPSTEAGSGNEEDDLELIEIEDEAVEEVEEVDDELVWFDDLDLEQTPPSPELAAEAAAPATPLSDADMEIFPETSAADVFAANVASGLTATDSASDVFSSAAAAVLAASPLASPPPASPIQPPVSEEPPIAGNVSLSTEQIDAAIERVIERRLGGTLESIVLQAVETAVANEIQRLKTLLLNDDFEDRTP